MTQRILITGGLGFVGGRLAQSLSGTSEVFVTSRQKITKPIREAYAPSIRFVNHEDLLNSSAFPDRIDLVIHTTAMNERASASDPEGAVRVNVEGTRKVLERAIDRGVQKIIYFSTIHVYGKQNSEVTEQSATQPLSLYAITHKAAEDHIVAAHDSGRIQGIVVRMGNSFGRPVLESANCWHLLVNDISRQVATTQKICLNSDGGQYRDFIPLSYVVNAIEFLSCSRLQRDNSVFNLTSGSSMSILEMTELVVKVSAEAFGIKVPIERLQSLDETGNQNRVKIVSDSIRRAGFISGINYEKEIEDLLMYCKTHFANV